MREYAGRFVRCECVLSRRSRPTWVNVGVWMRLENQRVREGADVRGLYVNNTEKKMY